MNALTVIETTQPIDAWLDRGRNLAAQRRDVDWQLADWLREGQDQSFIDQTGFDFLSDNLGIAPKRLKDITKAASVFPAHLRDSALSIEHHAAVAALEVQDALPLLNTAKAQHWTPERTRVEAITIRNPEPGTRSDRDGDGLLESIIRHWNRLPRAIRVDFAELVASANGEEIEP